MLMTMQSTFAGARHAYEAVTEQAENEDLFKGQKPSAPLQLLREDLPHPDL